MKVLAAAAALLTLAASWAAAAQEQGPVKIVNVVELSGPGGIAGSNFNNGVLLGFKEINAAGGILGRKVEVAVSDTGTSLEAAKEQVKKAAEMNAFAVMGPVFSSSVLASMDETRRAEIPNFVGAEAAEVTMRQNPYVFRTSLNQAAAMPKLAAYMKNTVRAETVAMLWVNNDFGKGGRDAMTKALQDVGIKLVGDIAIEQKQTDFSDVVRKVKGMNADALFVYLNEEESPFCLLELYNQNYEKWVLGETTLVGQNVIDTAGEAANGIRGHVGLTPDALVPAIRSFHNKFVREYKYKSDHNGMKGYIAAHVLKAATERAGSLDRKAVAKAMKGLTLLARDHPGILLDVKYDDKGDLDRASFIVRVSGGRHEFLAKLPPLASF